MQHAHNNFTLLMLHFCIQLGADQRMTAATPLPLPYDHLFGDTTHAARSHNSAAYRNRSQVDCQPAHCKQRTYYVKIGIIQLYSTGTA
jgi:hypothetical protein